MVKILSLLCLTLALPHLSWGQTDLFNDGDDSEWNKLDLSEVELQGAEYSFVDDGQGGQAYRILTPAPPVPDAGPARSFIYRTEQQYTDIFAGVDILEWDNELDQAFGFLFRAGDIGLGATTGYVLNYDPQQDSGGRGQFQINRITEEVPETIAVAEISLHPQRQYRFVLEVTGQRMTGRIYDLTDLTSPLVTISTEDNVYPSGFIGLFNFNRTDPPEQQDPELGKADVTFDNFIAQESAPTTVSLPAVTHGIPGMPQAIERTPPSFANFYPAAEGLAFTATTLTDDPISSDRIRLFLNGDDVTSQLTIEGGPNEHQVSYSGLQPNRYYEARIELTDGAELNFNQQWNFDTFEESFLESDAVEVIEVEDYNYQGGGYQDDPPVSGFNLTDGSQVRGWTQGQPGEGEGYLDAPGEPDIDYFDYSDEIGGGLTAEYRIEDTVGTQDGTDTDGAEFFNDTQRQKYAAEDLPEYQVRRTEGGEWLNYTRDFPAGEYNAYLRVASRASQPVHLDRVTSDPATTDQTTERLGTFDVPSTTMKINYRFVPLTDENGNPLRLALEDTETLRLTLGGDRQDATEYTMILNYMILAPAQENGGPDLVLESAPAVTGEFQTETAAVWDDEAQTFTLAVPETDRFFRLRHEPVAQEELTISSIRLEGDQLLLEYVISMP